MHQYCILLHLTINKYCIIAGMAASSAAVYCSGTYFLFIVCVRCILYSKIVVPLFIKWWYSTVQYTAQNGYMYTVPVSTPRSHDSTNRSVNKYQCRCCFCFQCCFQCCCRGASRTSSGLLVQLEALCCLVFSFLFQDDALILFDVVLRRLSFCCCCCF